MDPNPTPSPSSADGVLPEKYIRTFEGDVDVFKRGGTPGLAPLKRSDPVPSERLVAASPIINEPKLIVTAEPALSEPVVVTPTEPEVPTLQLPTPIKTYSEDFRQRLKDTNASTATVLAAEQDAAERPSVVEVGTPAPDSRSLWYIVAGLVLVVAGGAGTYIAYDKYLAAVMPVELAPANSAPIFVDSSGQIAGSGNAAVQAIVQAMSQPLAANSVRHLSLASATSTNNVFLALGAPIPGILVRNMNTSGNMAGIVNANGTQSPFFILSVELYSATFSGMLSWEPTMQRDLKALYPLFPAPAVTATASSTATTTQSGTASSTIPAPGRKEGFRDEVVSNHDVRIYRDLANRSILVYGYWNPETLIIARDPISFAEILDRLATSRAL